MASSFDRVGRRADDISAIQPLSGPTRPRKTADSDLPDIYRSKGFVDDLKTGRWMLVPCKFCCGLGAMTTLADPGANSLRIQIDAGARGVVLEPPALATLRDPIAGHAEPF